MKVNSSPTQIRHFRLIRGVTITVVVSDRPSVHPTAASPDRPVDGSHPDPVPLRSGP
jgi:hypothetical protein